MMNLFRTEPTAQTPLIDLNHVTGQMEIKGRSIPDDPENFWNPVLAWFDEYMSDPKDNTLIKIDLEYFNITSSKRILFLLYKLNDLIDSGRKASVEWHYREADEDMFEVGQDYAFMVRVPFIFKEYRDNDINVS